ncbi:MAG: DUF488 family protein [Candidatus Dormibacteraceae bacterium]
MSSPIYTIGHSTRSLEKLVELLQQNQITQLIDVRSRPGSRRLPHFNANHLAQSLPLNGIKYLQLPALGGLRKTRPDSPNQGWRNLSFRGYADYMASDEWRQGLDQLITLSQSAVTSVMCAEAVPWRCHRSLIADGLVARDIEVHHIIGKKTPGVHFLNPLACVKDDHITYPGTLRLPLDE